MLAKPESGTPDCNMLTIKEKDNSFVFYTNEYMKDHNWTAENYTKTWLIITAIHTTWAAVKLKPEKIQAWKGIWTHDQELQY